MVKRTMILAVFLLIPGALFSLPSDPSASVPVTTTASVAAVSVPPGSTGPALDFAAWLKDQGQTPIPVSGCGPNFCTQQQRTQCAQSCLHHPFVGLECCTDTCTSFCNCGSVPTGC
jgi:hypothetical protein